MKRIIIVLCAATALCAGSFAKDVKQPDSYNYQRGIELIQDEKIEEGIDFLKKETAQNPKNGYAYAWLASAYVQKSENGNAIHYADLALKNLPKADKYYQAWTIHLKGRIYLIMEDSTEALNCFTQAIKTEPKNADWYASRGLLYRDVSNWDKSDADFRQYQKLTPGYIRGYLYLGRNLFLQEKYPEALEQYQYAHKLAEFSYTYSAMAEVEVKLGKYEEAADHIVEALKLEAYESNALELLGECKEEELIELLTNKFKVQTLANPNVVDWYLYMLYLQKAQKEYEKAILTCKKILTIEPDAYFDDMMADLYADMGDWEQALQYANKAIESDSTDIEYRYKRAYICNELNDEEQLYADINYLVERHPDNARMYFARASVNLFHKNYQQALEDYNLGLAIESGDDWNRYMRARCLQMTGEEAKAKKDYERVLEQTKKEETRMFALASLGRKEEAMQMADNLLKKDTTQYRYNVACAYALLGEKELAFKELEKELRDGYVCFNHLHLDPDLQSMQGEELEQLIQQYEAKAKERIENFSTEQGERKGEEKIVEVPFTAANGVTKVDCTINGLPLNFVFDTGASTVSLSQVEANFMLKNGYLSSKDIVGKQYFSNADGAISEGTVVVLKNINFGGLELKDVRASVTKSQRAPLLLGQTILQRLGKIEIDNEKRVIKITTR